MASTRGLSEKIAHVVCLKFEFETSIQDGIRDANLQDVEQLRKIINQSMDMLNGCLQSLEKRCDALSVPPPMTTRLCTDFTSQLKLTAGQQPIPPRINVDQQTKPAPVTIAKATRSSPVPPKPSTSAMVSAAPGKKNPGQAVVQPVPKKSKVFVPKHPNQLFIAHVTKKAAKPPVLLKQPDWDLKAYFPEIPEGITEEHLRTFFLMYGSVVSVSLFKRGGNTSTKKVGVIQFNTKEASQAVINCTFSVNGRAVRVTPYNDNQVLVKPKPVPKTKVKSPSKNPAVKPPSNPAQSGSDLADPTQSGTDVVETLGNASHFTDKCINCKIARVDCVLLWCGHVNLCELCASQMTSCPMVGCGQEIEKVMKLDDR